MALYLTPAVSLAVTIAPTRRGNSSLTHGRTIAPTRGSNRIATDWPIMSAVVTIASTRGSNAIRARVVRREWTRHHHPYEGQQLECGQGLSRALGASPSPLRGVATFPSIADLR